VNPNTLSQVINSREGKNFYDYINLLRIADFKEQIQQPESQKYSLLGLATQCGFNSKTTFNRNFKKATGLSPTEYLAKNNISLQ
jgi:AraC-like DNA-binding protein